MNIQRAWAIIVIMSLVAAVGCTSQMPDVKDAPDGTGSGDLRAVLVDRDGNCYISKPKTITARDSSLGEAAGLGDFVFVGDCSLLFKEGWHGR